MLRRVDGNVSQFLSSSMFSTIQKREERLAAGKQSSSASDILVASYNVHKCVGVDKRFDPDRIAAVITEIGADIIALQEADQRFGRRAGLLELARLKRECGLIPVSAPSAPKGRRWRSHGWCGNVLLFRKGRVRDVHQLKLPGVEPRGALIADVDLDAGPLCIVAAHFGLLRRSRAKQAEAIMAEVLSRASTPVLLLGDLNEWRVGGYSSLKNLDPAFGPLNVAVPSFPSRYPVFPLDRILGNPNHMVSTVEVHDTPLARVASDHLPIKARVDLTSAASHFSRMNEAQAAA